MPSHFDIKKVYKLLASKYYWPIFLHIIETYVKDCNIYSVLKKVRYKFYADL